MRSTRTTTLTTLASSCSPYRLPLAQHQRSAAQYFTGLHPHINTSYTTLTSNMRAIIVSKQGDPSVLELKHDLPLPTPAPGQVLVEVKAAGVNPVDTYIRSGGNGYSVSLPYTPGADGAGVVVDAPAPSAFKPGDRVYFASTLTGSYASHALAKESQLHPLPEKVSFGQGAAVNVPYSTAYRALIIKGKARPGQTVLVHGASGGVGIAAVQIAASLGLRIIGTASTKEGQELVLREGAHAVFNHRDEDYLQRIKESTRDGAGVDIVIEMLANVNLAKDLDVIKRGGSVVIVGSRGEINFAPRLIMAKEAIVTAVALAQSTPEELAEHHAFIGAGLANGTLRPVVDKEFALGDAPKAHEEVISGTHAGKIVLLP